MKSFYILTITFFLASISIFASKPYRVIATKGINVRSTPSLEGEKIGKIPFRSVVEVIERTDITMIVPDNGIRVGGNWVKANYQSHFFINEKENSGNIEGFIFDGFITPLNKGRLNVKVDTLSLSEYNWLTSNKETCFNNGNSKAKAITDLKEIKEKLKNKVRWHNIADQERGYYSNHHIYSFTNDYAQELIIYPEVNRFEEAYYIESYFPEEDIINVEYGHGTISFSLKTGETSHDPQHSCYSPNKTFRLAGNYDGQETIVYAIEMKDGEWYNYSEKLNFPYDWMSIDQLFWLNENDFVFRIKQVEYLYLKGRISFWPNEERVIE